MTDTLPIDPKMLEVLACPNDDNRPPLRLAGQTLVCDQCGRVYPIEDGCPNLLPDAGVPPRP